MAKKLSFFKILASRAQNLKKTRCHVVNLNMGIVSSSISPAAGIITGTQNAENSARSSQAATANTNQIISPSSSAAIVTLSSDSKSRGVSTGEGRSVDASFEKQESGGGGEVSTKEKSSGKGQVVNVAA